MCSDACAFASPLTPPHCHPAPILSIPFISLNLSLLPCYPSICSPRHSSDNPFSVFPGASPPLPIVSRILSKSLSPFISNSSTLFCAFLRVAKTQLYCFQALPHSSAKTPGVWGCWLPSPTPRRSEWGRVAFLTFLLPLSNSHSFVPLRPNLLGATIVIGATFLRLPGKQLRSPRCLRIVSGHRGRVDAGPRCKSCLGLSF